MFASLLFAGLVLFVHIPAYLFNYFNIISLRKCSLPYDDNSVTERYKIGIHIRGQSTRGSQKKAFSVKMYDYDNTEQLKSMLHFFILMLL